MREGDVTDESCFAFCLVYFSQNLSFENSKTAELRCKTVNLDNMKKISIFFQGFFNAVILFF